MERIPEPELMKQKEQVTSYAEADFSEGENNLIKQIKFYLKKNDIFLNENDLIVDLGCGPGNISEKLSLTWPDSEVIGIDGSEEMILKAESSKNKFLNQDKMKKLRYLCLDIKNLEPNLISSKEKITLLVSNSLIHHLRYLDDFLNCIRRLSNEKTVNFHKDLKRPNDEKSALELKSKCSSKYDETLTNDYFASLKASYTMKEMQKSLFDNKFHNLDVFEEGNQYLIIYGKV